MKANLLSMLDFLPNARIKMNAQTNEQKINKMETKTSKFASQTIPHRQQQKTIKICLACSSCLFV